MANCETRAGCHPRSVSRACRATELVVFPVVRVGLTASADGIAPHSLRPTESRGVVRDVLGLQLG